MQENRFSGFPTRSNTATEDDWMLEMLELERKVIETKTKALLSHMQKSGFLMTRFI